MRILFISNGHGEDLNGSLIAQEIKQIDSKIEVFALPIVGEGNSYLKNEIELIIRNENMPSGGMFYLNPLNFIKDLFSGLIGLTIKQLLVLRKKDKNFDLIVAVGDIVPIFFAYLTGKKFMVFLVATSSYYEGKLRLPFLTKILLKSPQCSKIFAKDKLTLIDLKKEGFKNIFCYGYPIMDALKPTDKKLELLPHIPTIALLPGSRIPEALRNLELQLIVCEELFLLSKSPYNFRIALVSSIKNEDLQLIANKQKYEYINNYKFVKYINDQKLEIIGYNDAFANILIQSNLVLGMAGTAVEQAVGLGKPVVQIVGEGPQFTYRFAEAQMRLLGSNITTINNNESTQIMCHKAALEIIKILSNPSYLQECIDNGLERIGEKGASQKMALEILSYNHE